MWYLIQDFEDLVTRALRNWPIYERIVELKIDKVPNTQIREILEKEFDNTYSLEYISSLWRNKIPKTIAQCAINEFIENVKKIGISLMGQTLILFFQKIIQAKMVFTLYVKSVVIERGKI